MKIVGLMFLALVLVATPTAAQEHRWHGGGGNWNHGWHGQNDLGTNILGGIIGGAIGSWFIRPDPVVIIQPEPEILPWSGQWYAYCTRRYRSFDAQSGTYMGFDQRRHLCEP
jgi:hypothetical protein